MKTNYWNVYKIIPNGSNHFLCKLVVVEEENSRIGFEAKVAEMRKTVETMEDEIVAKFWECYRKKVQF
jgi:hypothetical protein